MFSIACKKYALLLYFDDDIARIKIPTKIEFAFTLGAASTLDEFCFKAQFHFLAQIR